MTAPSAAVAGTTSLVSAAGYWALRHHGSVAVRRWRPSQLPRDRVGRLSVRGSDRGGPVLVLLHGLVATGDIFGRDFDALAERATLVVPDLLGFGRSLDEHRTRFSPDDHLDALDDVLDLLGLADRPIVVGAHSMGSALAVRWMQRRGSQIRSLICWGPPIYPDSQAVDHALAASGSMTRLFVANTRLAALACRLNCRHRTAAGLVAAALSPSLPVPISRAASLHTWPAYRDAMEDLVAATDWRRCLEDIADDGGGVELTWGLDDRIGDRAVAATLRAAVRIVPQAGHHLPLTHPEICLGQLSAGLARCGVKEPGESRHGSGPATRTSAARSSR